MKVMSGIEKSVDETTAQLSHLSAQSGTRRNPEEREIYSFIVMPAKLSTTSLVRNPPNPFLILVMFVLMQSPAKEKARTTHLSSPTIRYSWKAVNLQSFFSSKIILFKNSNTDNFNEMRKIDNYHGSVASTDNDSDALTPPQHLSRASAAAEHRALSTQPPCRRRLRLFEKNASTEDMPKFEEAAPAGVSEADLREDDEFVSNDKEGVSDFAESEVEGVARRYLIKTLNRTLVELYHACDSDGDLDRCDHALTILQEATRSFQGLRDKLSTAYSGSHEEEKIEASDQNSIVKYFDGCIQAEPCSESSHAASRSGFRNVKEVCENRGLTRMASQSCAHDNGLEVKAGLEDSVHDKPQTWCDIVRRQESQNMAINTPDFSSGQRSLHTKLLSPDRHRKNPEVMQRKHEEKQELAKRKREELEMLRQEKLREAEQQRQEKIRQMKEKRETEKISMDERLKRAHDLYQSRLLERQLKAGKETAKVHEVKQEIAFIDLLTAENKTMALQTRLELAEARRLQTLEVAAKVSERTAREVSARQRRTAIEEAKIERLQARKVQKFGPVCESAGPDPTEFEVTRLPSNRDDKSSVAREEAARLRREQLEIERQRKVEQSAQEKEHRAEEHQRKLLEERMKVLAAKEARLRHQANHLERMTQAMQADAQAQRDSLEQRLQSVLERKQRYMAQIVAKAQGDKISASLHLGSEASTEQAAVIPEQSADDVEDKVSKSQRKLAKKYKQRLASIRNAWQESEEYAHPCFRTGVAGSRISKISRLFSDAIKGAPSGEDLERLVASSRGASCMRQPCKDVEGMLRTFQEIHRAAKGYELECKSGGLSDEGELLYSAIRKSGCIAAMIRVISADEKLMFPRLLSSVLKVLVDICTNETNRLYLITTGRVIPLVDKLDITLCSLNASFTDIESLTLLRSLMSVISVCFTCNCQTAIQIQARDDTLGYLVNAGILLKLERAIISIIRLIAGSAASKAIESSETKGLAFSTHFKILEVAVTLVEAITICQESNGQIKSEVRDKSVLANLVATLDDCRLVGLVSLLSTLFLDVKICTLQSPSCDTSKELESCTGPSKSQVSYSCAIKALRTLNNIALLDLNLVQRALGSVVICSEFSHVAMAILDSCSRTAGVRPDTLQGGLQLPSSEMLHELVLLLGHMAYTSSPAVQSPFAGWRNGVKMLQQLCALPLPYFISPPLREVMLPTLIVATYKNPGLLDAMRDQVSASLLATYLNHYRHCVDNKGMDPTGIPADGLSKAWARFPPSSVPCRFHLENRFPRDKWRDASEWFRLWRFEVATDEIPPDATSA